MSEASNDNSLAVLILGMHRSGTSFLAGSLQAAGLELGQVSDRADHNKRGNKENRLFVNFNQRVLQTNGGSWDAPPSNPTWNTHQSVRARELIGPFAQTSRWGFKDPRTLLLLSEWESLLPNSTPVGIFRHPEAVVASLHKRNAMPTDQAYALWCHYNALLLARYRSSPFPLLCFDCRPDQLLQAVEQVGAYLGLEPDESTEPFFSAELVNSGQNAAAHITDDAARELYTALKEASGEWGGVSRRAYRRPAP